MNLIENLKRVKAISRKLVMLEDLDIREILEKLADNLEKNADKIIQANARDLEKIDKNDHIYDRVLLNEERVKAVAKSTREIAAYDSPIDIELEKRTLKNGLLLSKVSVPLGVVGAIFEARPNIIIDIFVLCFKSKNACVMKGGSDSENSNEVLVSLINEVLGEWKDALLLLPNDRAMIAEFLKATGYVDVIVPRGSQELIDYVRENSSIPVIETGRGVVHVYLDESGEPEMAREIVFNAKTSRPSVCNSLDTLIIYRSRLGDLSKICEKLAEAKVEIFADRESYAELNGNYPADLLNEASEGNFGMEYLSLKMSVKTVDDLDEAIEHINNFGSGHTETIITEDKVSAEKFIKAVDAASVFVNASTRFSDGGEYGLGAEVGISTQKLHARGPFGIKELTTYKWILRGNGQVRC